jgi:hypothetical protein
MIFKRDELFKYVCNFRTLNENGTHDVGTGFFVSHNNSLYLITATHVAVKTAKNTTIILSEPLGKPTEFKLNEVASKLYFQHNIADICLYRINEEYSVLFKDRGFPSTQIHSPETPPSRDIELTSIGFPQGLGVVDYFSPLSYRSHAASSFINFNRFDKAQNCTFFVLENPAMAGYSGCPIFDMGYVTYGKMTIEGEKTICYGIMHGTLYDSTGGKIAAVTPSCYLMYLLEDAQKQGF